jgi:hypothetical protein
MNSYVVEVVLFTAKPDVTEAQMREAAQYSAAELESLPGLLKRELLLNADGQWIDIGHWESLEHAMQALELVKEKPTIQAFFNLIDEASVQMFHLNPVHTQN